MENLISLPPLVAQSTTKALGVAGSICGRTLAKPSAEDAGSIRRTSAAINLQEIRFEIKKRLQDKSESDGHDQIAFDRASRCVMTVRLFR